MFNYDFTDSFNLSFYLTATMIVGTDNFQPAIKHLEYGLYNVLGEFFCLGPPVPQSNDYGVVT